MISDFLITCSGADRAILAKTPTDRAKYAGLGGAVLTTSGMAAVSCFFALRAFVDCPVPLAGTLGFLWGLVIFNLDRWLVSALKRRPTFWGNLASFAPRLLLAAILGTVIAEPLVLTIFGPEIAKEQVVMNSEDASDRAADLETDKRFVGMPAMKKEIERLRAVAEGKVDPAAVLDHPEVKDLTARLATKQNELNLAEQAVICETEGTCGTGKVSYGPAAELKAQWRDKIRGERDALQAELGAKKDEVSKRLAGQAGTAQDSAKAELAKLETTYADLVDQKDAEEAAFDGKNAASTGVLAQMEALHRLAGSDGTLNAAQWMLRLFVITIDTLPVLVKFLMTLFPPSPYEKALEREEADTDQRLADELEDRRELDRMEAELARVEAEARFQVDKDAAQTTADQIAAARARLSEELVRLWEADQLAAIQADPSSFIVT